MLIDFPQQTQYEAQNGKSVTVLGKNHQGYFTGLNEDGGVKRYVTLSKEGVALGKDKGWSLKGEQE